MARAIVGGGDRVVVARFDRAVTPVCGYDVLW